MQIATPIFALAAPEDSGGAGGIAVSKPDIIEGGDVSFLSIMAMADGAHAQPVGEPVPDSTMATSTFSDHVAASLTDVPFPQAVDTSGDLPSVEEQVIDIKGEISDIAGLPGTGFSDEFALSNGPVWATPADIPGGHAKGRDQVSSPSSAPVEQSGQKGSDLPSLSGSFTDVDGVTSGFPQGRDKTGAGDQAMLGGNEVIRGSPDIGAYPPQTSESERRQVATFVMSEADTQFPSTRHASIGTAQTVSGGMPWFSTDSAHPAGDVGLSIGGDKAGWIAPEQSGRADQSGVSLEGAVTAQKPGAETRKNHVKSVMVGLEGQRGEQPVPDGKTVLSQQHSSDVPSRGTASLDASPVGKVTTATQAQAQSATTALSKYEGSQLNVVREDTRRLESVVTSEPMGPPPQSTPPSTALSNAAGGKLVPSPPSAQGKPGGVTSDVTADVTNPDPARNDQARIAPEASVAPHPHAQAATSMQAAAAPMAIAASLPPDATEVRVRDGLEGGELAPLEVKAGGDLLDTG